jgi:hypothetical protein
MTAPTNAGTNSSTGRFRHLGWPISMAEILFPGRALFISVVRLAISGISGMFLSL